MQLYNENQWEYAAFLDLDLGSTKYFKTSHRTPKDSTLDDPDLMEKSDVARRLIFIMFSLFCICVF